MFRITRDPSSQCSIQCSLDYEIHTRTVLCSTHTVPLYTVQYTHSASLHCAVHARTTGKYVAITPTTSISTDTIEPLL